MLIQGLVPQSGALSRLLHNLRSGDVVSLKVVGRSSAGYEVSVKGMRLSVTSAIPLKEGSIMQARVFIRGGSVVFQAAQSEARAAEYLRDAGLPDDGLSRLLLRAFKAAGLPLQPELLSRGLQRFRAAKRHDEGTAGFIAAMFDKGLDAPSDVIDHLYGLGKDGGRRRGRNDNRRKEEDGPPPEEHIKEIVKAGEGEDPVHLFNHIAGSKDHWVIIPLSTPREYGALEGSLRLRLDKATWKPLDMHLFCRSGEGAWKFTLSDLPGPGGRIQIRTNRHPDGRTVSEELAKLRQKLHNLGVKVDDIKKEDNVYGGMTEEDDIAFEGVDTYV